MPIKIKKDLTKKYLVKLDISSAKNGESMVLKINAPKDINVANHVPIILSGSGASAYIKSSPKGIMIDGAFGDWENIEKIRDIDDDAVENPNIDIKNYAVVESEEDISFYLDVEGHIFDGSELPNDPHRIVRRPISNPPVSVGTDTNQPLPELSSRTGEDSLYIFLDTDHDIKTLLATFIDLWARIGKLLGNGVIH
jgi:hypothetical protein